MKFFVGLHHPSDAHRFEAACISVNALRGRKKPLGIPAWIMDSGAFTELSRHGHYRSSVEDYAAEIARWTYDPALLAVVAQDYMCERWIVEKTGLSIEEHQRLTIERYDALLPLVNGVHVMPVLQGYTVADYLRHIADYGDRLKHGAWVGVGSVCKRNTSPFEVEGIVTAIHRARPDLLLHGFGIKTTALWLASVWDLLYSTDSMAWSYSAWKQGRNANDWREAKRFAARIAAQPVQCGFVDF